MARVRSLVQKLFIRVITEDFHLKSRLDILLLHIHEIAFSHEAQNQLKTLVDDEKDNYWENFYLPISRYGISTVTILYYFLIKYSYQYNVTDATRYLSLNAQRLIDFNSQLFHIEDIIGSEANSKSSIQKEIERNIHVLSGNIIHLSILLYKNIMSKELPLDLFNMICVPLSDQCNNVGKYFGISSVDLVDNLFFQHEFNSPMHSPIAEAFEMNVVHESGSYTPRYYGFNSYWLSISCQRYLEGKPIIPTKLDKPTLANIHRLEGYYNGIISRSIKIIDLFDQDTLDSFYNMYEKHLENLIENAKKHQE